MWVVNTHESRNRPCPIVSQERTQCKYPTDLYGNKLVCEFSWYTVFTVDKEIDMTTREHMEDLAQRYASALVSYHLNHSRDSFNICRDLHNMLNSVCVEMAQEILEDQ